ncbi:MAG: YtxH domain-containing protein [bacterium]|nr:YtxH domain-containing protein [bacterium]
MSRQNDYQNNDNTFQTGVLGLALGFIAGAAMVILSDPDKREKATEMIEKTKSTTLNTVNKVADTVKSKTDQIQSTVTEVVEKADSMLNDEISKIEKNKDEDVV